MKIALLGSGHIGRTIARLFTDTGTIKLTVIDRDAQALAPLREARHRYPARARLASAEPSRKCHRRATTPW
jgi:3-hydroxyacyl-CoA dehydrogenase